MTASSATSFGDVLRSYRLAAALSQEALAERAGLSVDAIRALERGRRSAPRAETLALLATALHLAPGERAALIAAATGTRAPPAVPLPAAQVATPTAVPPDLPRPPTALIGRERERADVLALLRDGARLLTLTGPGGVGKTRLALAVAMAARDAYDDVAFVDLAALSDPTLVAPTVARALGVRVSGAQEAREALQTYLQPRHLLLVLDNFERVVEAAPLPAALVTACPRLTILATSRAPLQVRAEQRFAVPPLETPEPARYGSLEHVADAPAVRLFVDRAQAADPAFHLDTATAPAVAAISARLDGLPLALELAASWVRLLPPPALLKRLERRLTVLTGGAHDLPTRQRTLRDTIAWSYELLSAEEQLLFARLAVFQGGRTLEAMEAVCDPAGELHALAGVEALVNTSLLRQEQAPAGEARFVMLETVYEYAGERLEASGEGPTWRRRHADYFLALAEQAAPQLQPPDQGAWLARLEPKHRNMRSALHWAYERGEVELGLRLAAALWRFWLVHGHLSEGRDWLERFLAMSAAGTVDPTVRARALAGAGWLAHRQNDFERAAALLEESLAVHRASTRNQAGIADVLINRGLVAHAQGDYVRAAALLEESLALHRQQGDRAGVGGVLFRLGIVTRERGDYARATAMYEECLALHRALGDREHIAVCLLGLGDIARDRGEPEQAAQLSAQSLDIFRELGERWGSGCALHNLGVAAAQQGDDARAVALLEESLSVFRELAIGGSVAEALVSLGRVSAARGEHGRSFDLLVEGLRLAAQAGPRWLVAAGLEGLAALAVAQEQHARAARLLGAAGALREWMGAPLRPANRADHDRTMAAARAALGQAAFEAAWAQGQSRPLDEVIAEAVVP